MTIVALSTPVGNSAIGVIRLSGEKAHKIALSVFRPLKNRAVFPAKTSVLGHVFDESGDIDKCVLQLWKAPATYTGEDMAEFYCHGGSVLLQMVVSALLRAGAEPAPAGEFTKRAFLNGKVDLAESEAIIDMINATSDMAAREAQSQANGALSKKIRECRKLLVKIDADIMAYVDFSNEGIGIIEQDDLISALCEVEHELGKLLATCARGAVIKSGASVCILGKPNVGKSTIMNTLSGFERCIVTDIPGTTRDVVEHQINLGGLLLRLFDTAGIHTANERVEAIGIEKSKRQAEEADIIFAVFDGSAPLTAEDLEIIALCKDKNAIYLLNKSDLFNGEILPCYKEKLPNPVLFSGVSGEGIDVLEKLVSEKYRRENGEVLLTSLRHSTAVRESLCSVRMALSAAKAGELPDMLELDLRNAIFELGKITGDDIVDDLLESIFSRFCVGK